LIMMDLLPNRLTDRAAVLLPTASWTEKAGTFENRDGVLQCFERAINPLDYCKGENQIALDLVTSLEDTSSPGYDAEAVRRRMAEIKGLESLAGLELPTVSDAPVESDMMLIDL